jgi:RNA polymerase primary sigma factor
MQQYTTYQQATKHKLLSREEEVDLAQRMESGDPRAREALITHNLRLAISIANKYRNANLPMEDLIQESNIGLIKAVDKFDWRRGFRFSTYACWWIKQCVRRYVSGASSHVKFPTGSRTLIWKINNVRKEYEEEFHKMPTDGEVAAILGEQERKVSELRRAMQWPINLDSPIGGEEGSRTFGETIEDDGLVDMDNVIDQEQVLDLIRAALSRLSSQEERVMRLRFGLSEDQYNTQQFPTNKMIQGVK